MTDAEGNQDLASQYKLQRASPENAEAILACAKRAFQKDHLMSQVYPEEKAHLTSAEELTEWRANRLRKSLAQDHVLSFVVVEGSDTHRVLAYATFFRPDHFRPGTSLQQSYGQSSTQSSENTHVESDATQCIPERSPSSGIGDDGFPASMNIELYNEFLSRMDEGKPTKTIMRCITY